MTATSGPDANITCAESGSPAYSIAVTACRSLSPGSAAPTIEATAREARDAAHSKTAIWSALETDRSPSRGLITTSVASSSAPSTPTSSRIASTMKAAAATGVAAKLHSPGSKYFQPTMAALVPARTPAAPSASATLRP